MENYGGVRGSLVIFLVCLQLLLRSTDNTGNKFPRAIFLATLLHNMSERDLVFFCNPRGQQVDWSFSLCAICNSK